MEIKELTIDRLIAGGDGIGYFVPQVLPGERVEVKIIEVKKGFNRCLLINVLEPSDKRIEPFCKNYTQCGGCSFQFTSYNNQIDYTKYI
ncbi:MAG: hypothetical protein B6229_07910 [Spirochaetaceae bacterium 4572_7]|nr:MAG: hypothetical protein B6229_07910 [Spirochaetaceae bacterium 4572_7]